MCLPPAFADLRGGRHQLPPSVPRSPGIIPAVLSAVFFRPLRGGCSIGAGAVVVAGGGFSGVEVVAELNDFVREVARNYPSVDSRDIRVVLPNTYAETEPVFPWRA